MYLSVSRYRAAGYGIDVSDMEDAELRAVLARASSLVDVYCGTPMQPSRHDFRGGTISGEQHDWRLATDVVSGSRRVYLLHRPIKEVTSFVVKFTTSYQITVSPSNLYVNKIDGWAEVVALAAVVSGLYPVGLNFGLYTPVAEVGYDYGFDFSEDEEQLYVVDGNTYQAVRGSWDTSPAPVIKRNGTVINTGFTIDSDEGQIVFDSPQAATDVITASYSYTLPDAIADATGITATHLLGERSLAAKGMTGLNSIRIAELALQRSRGRTGNTDDPQTSQVIPQEAQSLLDPFRYRSVA